MGSRLLQKIISKERIQHSDEVWTFYLFPQSFFNDIFSLFSRVLGWEQSKVLLHTIFTGLRSSFIVLFLISCCPKVWYDREPWSSEPFELLRLKVLMFYMYIKEQIRYRKPCNVPRYLQDADTSANFAWISRFQKQVLDGIRYSSGTCNTINFWKVEDHKRH